MTAEPIRKDDFAMQAEVEPRVDAATASADTAAINAPGRRLLPSGLKPPAARAVFDAFWPPAAGIATFLLLWGLLAPMVHTSLGALPGPGDVWDAFKGLMVEYAAARAEAVAAAAAGSSYTGPPTFVDQIFTSLKTVGMGFTLASCLAVPFGLVAGMSRKFNSAINPLVQVMRPISPLAWLPIVTMVASLRSTRICSTSRACCASPGSSA
jgi:nitrate/nitrite transport system permease protein